MRKKFFIIIFLIVCIIPKAECQCSNCGTVVNKFSVFDTTLNEWVKLAADIKVYYKDSTVIVTKSKLFTAEMNGVLTDRHQEDLNYTYIDLHFKPSLKPPPFSKDSLYTNNYKTAIFYEYPAFSKDSFFTKKYSSLDTALKYVSWVFYLRYKKSIPDKQLAKEKDSIIKLSDTLINNIRFSRKKIYKKENTPGSLVRSILIDYYNCNTSNWMFIFEPEKDDSNCIFSRIDWLVLNKQPWLSQDHEFLPGLTKEQLEVFAAWEKNAKMYPIDQ